MAGVSFRFRDDTFVYTGDPPYVVETPLPLKGFTSRYAVTCGQCRQRVNMYTLDGIDFTFTAPPCEHWSLA